MVVLKKITNILLILLLLVTTMGITQHKHFCMDRLQTISYFQEAENCAQLMGLEKGAPCPMDCCDDTTEIFRLEEVNQIAIAYEFDTTPLWVPIPVTFQNVPVERFTNQSGLVYTDYSPPPPDRDITVHIQSFLL